MAVNQEILSLLRAFAQRKKSHILPYSELLTFVERYIAQKGDEHPGLRALASDTNLKLVAGFEELSEENRCTLTYSEGKIETIVFPELFQHVVRKRYQEIEADPEVYFPHEQSFQLDFPQELITPVDIRKDFVNLLGEKEKGPARLLRLNFPEGVNSVIVSSDFLTDKLQKLCVQRIRHYLNTQRNAHYMLSKLRGIFQTKEQVLRDII